MRSVLRSTPLPLAAAALIPLVVTIPLRLLLFSDRNPSTVLVLGPAAEEGLKLAGVLVALTAAGLVLRGGREPALAVRYWLFLAPWAVGGLYGAMEGVLAYPDQSAWDFLMREAVHGGFTALALTIALVAWRHRASRWVGLAFGLVAGGAAHFAFNEFGLLIVRAEVTFVDQGLYAAGVVLLALAVLGRAAVREPASAETRQILPRPARVPRA